MLDLPEPTTAAEVMERARAVQARRGPAKVINRVAEVRRLKQEREEAERERISKETLPKVMARYREVPVVGMVYRPKDRHTMKGLICAFAEARGYTYSDMIGPFRGRAVVEARHDLIAVLKREFPTASLPMIGRAMNRDHTSILHALRKRGFYSERSDAKANDDHKEAA